MDTVLNWASEKQSDLENIMREMNFNVPLQFEWIINKSPHITDLCVKKVQKTRRKKKGGSGCLLVTKSTSLINMVKSKKSTGVYIASELREL